MDDSKKLSAVLRTEDFGSAGSRRLRRAGKIPAVVYGKMEPIHVIVDAKEFSNKRRGFSESTLITLSVDKEKEHSVFVKTFQEDLLHDMILHIDFYEVTAGQKVRTRIKVELEGTPAGVRDGGVLDQITHEIEIECLPKDLIDAIVADVSALQINENLKVEDLNVPETIRVLTPADTTVATVKNVKEEKPAEVATAEEAQSDQPAEAASDAAKQ